MKKIPYTLLSFLFLLLYSCQSGNYLPWEYKNEVYEKLKLLDVDVIAYKKSDSIVNLVLTDKINFLAKFDAITDSIKANNYDYCQKLFLDNETMNDDLQKLTNQYELALKDIKNLNNEFYNTTKTLLEIKTELLKMSNKEIRRKNILSLLDTIHENKISSYFKQQNSVNKNIENLGLLLTSFYQKNKDYLDKLNVINKRRIYNVAENWNSEEFYNPGFYDLGNLLGFDYDVLKTARKKETDTISIIAVGDIMLGTNIPDGWIPPNNDCSPFFEKLAPVLSNANITFGNFEGVFTDTKVGAKNCIDPHWCYTFGMPSKYINCFVDAGFDILNIANNHSLDFGAAGLKQTMEIMAENNMRFAGTVSKPIDTLTVNGVKIGFCAFAPGGANCQITDLVAMQNTVKQLDSLCSIVIVSFHGGAEGEEHQHITREDEFYLEQNRGNVYKFAHLAIDAGADVILGHGPHVTRAIELYKERFICYSMGNFATYNFISYGSFGMAPIFKIFTNNEGKFQKAQIISVSPSQLGPRLDKKNKALKKIQELTTEDFPESRLIIGDDGWVFPRIGD